MILTGNQKLAVELTAMISSIPGFHFQVVACLESVKQSCHWLETNDSPDLIIADISLSDGLCFEIWDAVALHTPVITIANDDTHVLQSFRLNCLFYLHQPLIFTELKFAINKFQTLYQQTQNFSTSLSGSWSGVSKPFKKRFIIKTGDKLRHVSVEDIAYFYSQNDYTYLVAKENAKFIIDHKLDHLSEMLDPNLFFRLSRKFIGNIHAVKLVNKYFNSRLLVRLEPEPKEQILISRARVPLFLDWMER